MGGIARDVHKRMLRLQKQNSKAHMAMAEKSKAIWSHKAAKKWGIEKEKINQIPLWMNDASEREIQRFLLSVCIELKTRTLANEEKKLSSNQN